MNINRWPSKICLIIIILIVIVIVIDRCWIVSIKIFFRYSRVLWYSSIIIRVKCLIVFLNSFISLKSFKFIWIRRNAIILLIAIVCYISFILILNLFLSHIFVIVGIFLRISISVLLVLILILSIFTEVLFSFPHLYIFMSLLCQLSSSSLINLI